MAGSGREERDDEVDDDERTVEGPRAAAPAKPSKDDAAAPKEEDRETERRLARAAKVGPETTRTKSSRAPAPDRSKARPKAPALTPPAPFPDVAADADPIPKPAATPRASVAPAARSGASGSKAPEEAASATWMSPPPEETAVAAPGASTRPRGYVPTIPFLPGTPSAFEGAVADAVSHTRRRSEAPALAAEPAPLTSRRPPRIRELARERLLLFPETPSVTHHSTGRVLVRIGEAKGTDDRSFAARAEVIRAYAGEVSTQILERRVRGKSNGETFGTPASPVVRLEGHADVLLGARPGHALLPFDLEDGVAFFRESVLAGFELRLAFENGKLSADSSDATPMVQLEGTGVVVLELLHPLSSLEVSASKSVHLRKELVLGWTGRLVPRTIPAHEAPGGQHGFVGFGGEGVVLLASR